MEIIQSVQNRIYQVRGQRVILDKDIAFLYETETKSLNLSVKRHIDRFPLDFMFQLTKEEVDLLRLQKNQVNDMTLNLRFQIETSSCKDCGGINPKNFYLVCKSIEVARAMTLPDFPTAL